LVSRFFWLSLLRWGGALIMTTMLITELVFPSSFGILPSFRLWKLAFNGVVLIGWIVGIGYIVRKIKEKAEFTSFRQAFRANLALLIGMPLFFSLMVLTDGKPWGFALQIGLLGGVFFGIGPLIQILKYWRRYRRAK
jgi:phosphatidylserine synthase